MNLFFYIIIIVIVNIFIKYTKEKKKDNEDIYFNNSKNKSNTTTNFDKELDPYEETVFHKNNDDSVSLEDIDDDIFDIFDYDDNKYDNICDKKFTGTIVGFYENQKKKISVSKNINNHINNIIIYYKNGNIMYEYLRINFYTVSLSHYDISGNNISSNNFSVDMFNILMNPITLNDLIPYDFVLLYKLLDTCNLCQIINDNNLINVDVTTKIYNNSNSLSTINSNILSKDKTEDKTFDNDFFSNNTDSNVRNLIDTLDRVAKTKNNNLDTNLVTSNNIIEKSTKEIDFSPINKLIGESNGSFRKYYENGALQTIGILQNGKLEGRYSEYHPNGRIKTEGHYVNGKKNGVWKYLNDNGIIEKEENY